MSQIMLWAKVACEYRLQAHLISHSLSEARQSTCKHAACIHNIFRQLRANPKRMQGTWWSWIISLLSNYYHYENSNFSTVVDYVSEIRRAYEGQNLFHVFSPDKKEGRKCLLPLEMNPKDSVYRMAFVELYKMP